MVNEPSALIRCREIIRWINANPTVRRKAVDVAAGTKIPIASVHKTVTKDFPNCFIRTPNFGISWTGEWPAGQEFEIESDVCLSKDPVALIDPKKWKWDELALRQMAIMIRTTTGKNPTELFQTLDAEDAEVLRLTGRTMAEVFRRILNAKVIGTDKQATLKLTNQGPVWE